MSKKNNKSEGKVVVEDLLNKLKSGKAVVYSKSDTEKEDAEKQMLIDQKQVFFQAMIMLNATATILQKVEDLGAVKHKVKVSMGFALEEAKKSAKTTFHYDEEDVDLFVENANSQIQNFLNEYTKDIT